MAAYRVNQMANALLICTIIKYVFVFTCNSAAAGLTVTPDWNNSSFENGPESCFLELFNTTDEKIVFAGHSHHTCSLQVQTSDGTATAITISSEFSVHDFLYAERQGELLNCRNRYVVISENKPCVGELIHPKFRLFLQGNVSVHITETTINNALPVCSEGNGETGGSSRVKSDKPLSYP